VTTKAPRYVIVMDGATCLIANRRDTGEHVIVARCEIREFARRIVRLLNDDIDANHPQLPLGEGPREQLETRAQVCARCGMPHEEAREFDHEFESSRGAITVRKV